MAGEDVIFTIGADASGAKQAVQGFQSSSAVNFVLIGQQIDRVIGQFSRMGDSISRGFGTATDAFADVNQGMANVRSIVSGTNEEFERMEDLAVEIASELPTSTAEVAKGFFQLASAGLDANEIMATTPAVMNLAIAASTDFETAANGVTAAMATYGIGLDDVNKITDIFQATNVGFKTTMPELAESLKFAGAAAAVMGVSMEETAAAIGLARNAGLDASQAGTALRTVFSALAKPTDAARDAMRALNFTVGQNSEGGLDLERTFSNLRVAMVSIEDPLEKAAFLETVFGKRGVALANTLAINSEGFNKLAADLTIAGTTSSAVEIQMEGMKNQMEILNGTILDQQAALGEKLAPAQLLALGLKLKMFEAVNKLPGPFIKWGGGILLVGAELGKLIFPLIQTILQSVLLFSALGAQSAATATATVTTGAHTAATGTYTIAQTAANIALALFPAIIIIIAIVALIAIIFLLVKNWDKVTETMMRVWEWIKKNKDMLLIFLAVVAPFVGLPILIIANWDKVVKFLAAAWDFLIGALQAYVNFYIDAWKFIISSTIQIFADIFGAIQTGWNAIVDFTTGIFSFILNLYITAWTAIFDFTVGIFSAILNLYITAWSAVIDATVTAFKAVTGAIVNGIRAGIGAVGSAVQSVKNTILISIRGLISNAFTWGVDMVKNFISGITGSIPSVGSAASGLLGAVTGFLGFDIPENDRMAEKWGQDLGKFFAQGMGGAIPEVSLAGGDLVTAAAAGTGVVAGGGGGSATVIFSAGAIVLQGAAQEEDGRRFAKGMREEIIRSGVFSGRGGVPG